MKIKDKNLKKMVDVSCKECASFECYWPRPHPGIFNQGIGYTNTAECQKRHGYICGNREIRGCPENPKVKSGKK